MIALLQEYIRINTSHPNTNYAAVGALFARHAKRDGLLFNQIILPSGYPVFCITALGSDASLPALALTHHMDVVSAEQEGWTYPPFEGVIKDGLIFGRGAQDCKGLGVVHYQTLVHLHTAQILKPTVHMLILPHEEVGGFLGAGQLIHTDFFKQLRIGLVLDEGSSSGNQNTILVKVSERKPLQILLTSRELAGHAANTSAKNAIHELLACIQACREGLALINGEHVTSCHVTSLSAGSVHAHNVIPEKAQATVDIRVAAYHKSRDIEQLVRACIIQYPGITMEICAQVFDAPYIDFENSPAYHHITQAITKKGLHTKPLHFEASSDLRWYQSMGIEGYGITPFTGVDCKHEIDEHVALSDMQQGIEIMVEIVKKISC